MAVDPKLKTAVKEALKEIKYDEHHEKVHSIIRENIRRKLKPGMVGFGRCGLCNETLNLHMPVMPEITLNAI